MFVISRKYGCLARYIHIIFSFRAWLAGYDVVHGVKCELSGLSNPILPALSIIKILSLTYLLGHFEFLSPYAFAHLV